MEPENEKPIVYFRLQGAVQQYEWGLSGKNSLVYTYSGGLGEKDAPYAELWFGIHPKGMSVCPDLGGITLADYLTKTRGGPKAVKEFKFLLKILSIAKPLSIQAHPDRTLAALLHKTHPEHYPDDNHKPEMVIPLSNFNGLVGFMPIEMVATNFTMNPELAELLGNDLCTSLSTSATTATNSAETIKLVLECMLTKDKDIIDRCIMDLHNRLNTTPKVELTDAQSLFLQFNLHHPNDIGTLGPFIFNHVQLNAIASRSEITYNGENGGELSPSPSAAAFLSANIPHAYISGNCVEVMANSDNVVRAGLTNKFIDKSTLLNMLDYTCGPSNKYMINPVYQESHKTITLTYNTPIDDFKLTTYLCYKSAPLMIEKRNTYSLLLLFTASDPNNEGSILAGTAIDELDKHYPSGTCLFLESDCNLYLQSEQFELTVFRVY